MSGGDSYLYPGTAVLKNKLGILDASQLERTERKLTTQRMAQGIPTGRFDLDHLKAIHRHLFQDIYDWAGKIRTVEMSKDGNQFQFRQYIGTGMADIHRRLEQTNFLRNLSPKDFSEQAGHILGDINYVHLFREGNGRTQLAYLKQLAMQAGHAIDLTRFRPISWIVASRSAHASDYGLMADAIFRALE